MLEWLIDIDVTLFRFSNQTISNSVFDVLFPFITDLHKTALFKWLFVPAILIAMIYYKKVQGIFIFFCTLLTLGIGDFLGGRLKHFFQRPRPFEVELDAIQRSPAGGFSFPSNHSINMFAAAVFIGIHFPKTRIPLTLLATLVVFSRIYNGVHYPSDVAFGALLGCTIAFVCAKVSLKALNASFFKSKEGRSNV